MRMLRGLGLASPICVLALVAGCVAIDAAKGRPGVDLEDVRSGATRADVESVTGAPLRSWTNDVGTTFRSYVVDAGRAGKLFGWDGAATVIAADILTLGLIEWVSPPRSDEAAREAFLGSSETRTIIVAYDHEELVLGVFDEFDVLPADGIAPRVTH